MLTSGLILDIYDDYRGDTLRALYPRQSDMPESVKTAQVLSSEDRSNLPDDAFALVMINGGETLRKFACIDEGNTLLSLEYFVKNAHKLPIVAQKTAAENLMKACGWYDLAVPAVLEKIAGGGVSAPQTSGTDMGLRHTLDAVSPNMSAKPSPYLNSIHATPKVAPAPAKIAEVTGTTCMPLQEPTTKGTPKANVAKTAAATMKRLVAGHKGQTGNFGPEETEKYDGYTKGPNFDKLPQGKIVPKDTIAKTASMQPYVDVTDHHPEVVVTEKKASLFALPAIEKYPLDTYLQVKTAGEYFDEFSVRFEDEDRQEFATNLMKRASELGIDVSDEVRYAADPDEAIKVAFERPWSEVIGNDYINESQLKCLARKDGRILKKAFGEDFIDEFRKDPKGIFMSLPRDQKIIIMRMASDTSSSTL